MIKLLIDGEVCEFKSWQEVHDDYVSKTNCNCRELEHWECAENELTENHKWEEIERGPDAHDIATGDPQMTPDDITAHSEGLDCGMEDCEKCKPDQELFEGTSKMLGALTIRGKL